MKKYNVTGMSCAACSARVEKAVSRVDGVKSCAVNLLTNSMTVEGTAADNAIIAAVTAEGYNAEAVAKKGTKDSSSAQADTTDKEIKAMKKRLFSSLFFLLLLMYISMGHTMWGWHLPTALVNNYIAQGILQLLLAGIVMVINQRFFVNGFGSLLKGAPNMDTLVAMGSAAAFGYSLYALFAMTTVSGDIEAVHHYIHEFYFESAAMILTLITVGKLLETRSKGKTADAIKGLMRLTPEKATVIRNGKEVEIAAEDLKIGDIFVVRPGESIPADGVVIEGTTTVDESALTGESIPCDKAVGDVVTGATINRLGYIKCKTTHTAEDNTLAQIIKLVSEAAASKAPISKAADKVSGIFVPAIIAVAAITVFVWLVVGKTVGFALARGISVLVISCPCALGLATPVAIMVGSGVGARNGILFKTAASLEAMGKTQIAVLDKTGTVTMGEPNVTDIISYTDLSENEFLGVAASVESKSEHPLAAAVLRKVEEAKVSLCETNSFEALPGHGVIAELSGKRYIAGNIKLTEKYAALNASVHTDAERLSEQGKTPLIFSCDGRVLGIIAVADTLKNDSCEAISELKAMGIRTVMLTGDNEKTANAVAQQSGIDEVVAGVLPDGKSYTVKKLMKQGRVAMIGDGINDSPALKAADVGVAIGTGSDIAIDTADVVLMKSTLKDAVAAIRLSRAVLKNIYQNLFWAFVYNIIGIPLAAGVFIPIFGWQLNPMFGAAAMSLSSFCVVSNALRLNFTKIYGKNKANALKENIKEEETKMTKTLKIKGMMCPHCEATVKAALEGIADVANAEVNHKNGTAVVEVEAVISDDVLKKTVEDKGYAVISID